MAVILTSYYKHSPGGLCKRLFRAINALLAAGHDVHYLAVAPYPIVHPRCFFHRFPWPENRTNMLVFWGMFHLLAPLFLVFIGYRYKITHSFVFSHTYSLVMQPLRLLKQIPLTLFFHGDVLNKHRVKGRHHLLISLESLCERLALSGARSFSVSSSLANTVRSRHRFSTPPQIDILRNHLQKPPTRGHDHIAHSPPLTLSCVGTIDHNKNQRFLCDVMEGIMPEQARLCLFGIGPQKEELRELVHQRALEERIAFMGWTSPENIYPQTALLLMPSLSEGCPLAVLEALEYGIPVLASDIPEHREILPATSLLSIETPEKWVARIKEIVADPFTALSTMRTAQQPYAERLCFDWDERIVNIIVS